jgi:hypothetical protein
MCSKARPAEKEVTGASIGSGVGNQKLESPTSALQRKIPKHHARARFIAAHSTKPNA